MPKFLKTAGWIALSLVALILFPISVPIILVTLLAKKTPLPIWAKALGGTAIVFGWIVFLPTILPAPAPTVETPRVESEQTSGPTETPEPQAQVAVAPKEETAKAPTVRDEENPPQPVAAAQVPKPAPEKPAETPPAPKPTVTTPTPAPQEKPAEQPNLVSVTQVVDGDTFKVSIAGKAETIRLIGLDTPETVDPRKPVQCFGKEASDKAKALLSGKRVRLEADAGQGERDKYDRLLRYAFLEDGTSFNEWMIRQGYGREYTYDSAYKYQATYKAAEKDAQANKRGLWADNACQEPEPTPASQPAPEEQPAAQPSGRRFYTSDWHTARYYYCDTDEGWKGLDPDHLHSFASEAELLKKFNRTLHEPCK